MTSDLDLDHLTRNVMALSPPDLVKLAKALFAPADVDRHWTTVSKILGRVEDERIYENAEHGAHRSGEEWAKEKLGLTRGEYRLALKMWRLMQKAPEINWRAMKKPRALLLSEVLTAGGDVQAWVKHAVEATSTTAFEQQVRRYLEEETFLTLTIRYPESMAEMVDEAFRRAVYHGIEGDEEHPAPDPATWRKPGVAFRALEVLVAEYLQSTAPIPVERDGETSAI